MLLIPEDSQDPLHKSKNAKIKILEKIKNKDSKNNKTKIKHKLMVNRKNK